MKTLIALFALAALATLVFLLHLQMQKVDPAPVTKVVESCPGAARLTVEVGPFGKTIRGECIIE